MSGQEKQIIHSNNIPNLYTEHPLLAAGFSPELPRYLAKLNEQLSLIDKWNETTQWKSITVTLTPDPKYPKLETEAEYNQKRQVKITLFSSNKARFSISGKAPYEGMPDLIGVVGLPDMQDYVKKFMIPGGEAALCDIPEFSKDEKELFYEGFLELTQEAWEKLDQRLYSLNFLPGAAVVAPFSVGGYVTKCGIHGISYEESAPKVERALEDFTALLERNPPGKL